MVDVNIPNGFGIPLVDLTTHRLPQPTMDAIAASVGVSTGGGSRTIVLGDSIDAAVQGWFPYYAVLSKSMNVIRNAGVGGNTTAQMLARIQADVLDHNPDVVILGGTTNDTGNSISESVTRANIDQMVQMVRETGASVVLRTTPPTDVVGNGAWNTIALRRQAVLRSNAWITQYAAASGIDLLDIYQPLADPLTGGYVAGYSGDGVHPNETASKAVADRLITLPIPAVFSGGFAFARTVADDGNCLVNGVFMGDANTDGRADSWNTSGTATFTLTPATGGISGNWQRLTTASATAGSLIQDLQLASGVYAVGDLLQLVGRIRASGTSTTLVRFAGQDPVASWTKPIDGIFSLALPAPAGTSQRLMIQVSGAAGWAEVAEVAVRNLTQLGLA